MGNTLRITGLVRLADGVRRELAGPLSAVQRDRLRARVADSLRRVEEIARENGTRVDSLPEPSRRAIDFLKAIDWEKVPVSEESSIATHEHRRVSWPGLSRFVERAMDELSQPLSGEQLEAIRQSLERMSRQMEGTIARQKFGPEDLVRSARELRGWLAFFSRPENLAAYVEAIGKLNRAIGPDMAARKRFPPPIHVQFRPMRGIYKMRTTRLGTVLWVPAAAITFDQADFDLLGRLLSDSDREARRKIIERMTGEGFQAIQAELESLSGIVERSRGAVYDLGESFDRVNVRYFGGSMPRPKLTWSQSFTGRKFGHYDWLADTVMVSRTLDAPGVPGFVVDYIMYHELLHKKHGISWTNGRGYAHTAEFYREEKQFERYEQADALLGKLAAGSTGAGFDNE
ncbi:MAG TPA: hypothetical protein VLJ39_09710 [Tepidisphaeraceae bacterium]|nr:hypothetical protein [Tepidisphaeraceae bacterium]